jgi:hypothetical protein
LASTARAAAVGPSATDNTTASSSVSESSVMSRHRRREPSRRKAQVQECDVAGSVVEPAPRAWSRGTGDSVAILPHTLGIESSNAWASPTVQLSLTTNGSGAADSACVFGNT